MVMLLGDEPGLAAAFRPARRLSGRPITECEATAKFCVLFRTDFTVAVAAVVLSLR
jgi:hypothetical protein